MPYRVDQVTRWLAKRQRGRLCLSRLLFGSLGQVVLALMLSPLATIPTQAYQLPANSPASRVAQTDSALHGGLADNNLADDNLADNGLAGDLQREAAAVTLGSRSEPLSVEDALASFVVEPGYRIAAFAAEPLVVDPVEAVVDDRGRLWVVEMRDYPFPESPEATPRGRIRVLTDTDFDGRYDISEVFADGLDMPTGLALWGDGAVVTLAGQLTWFRDTNEDGTADTSQVWLRGFDQGNEQLRANHPRLGLDGLWYVASGLRGGTVQVDSKLPSDLPNTAPKDTDRNANTLDLGSRDVRYDPISQRLEAITGPAQFGLVFDAFGRRYFCSNRNPAVRVVFEQSDLLGNALTGVAPATVDVIPAGENSKVYPISDAWTTSNLHAGQYTAACGVFVLPTLGSAMKLPAVLDEVFVCEPTGSLITRQMIIAQGQRFEALPSDWNANRAWLASRDAWFRPVNLSSAPGGGVLVVDMHRAVIEHPHWVPEELKQRPDERWGTSAGRIYWAGPMPSGNPPKQVNLTSFLRDLSTNPLGGRTHAQLVALACSDDAWSRDTASRILVQRVVLPSEVVSSANVREESSADTWGSPSGTRLAEELWQQVCDPATPLLGRVRGMQLAWTLWLYDARTGPTNSAHEFDPLAATLRLLNEVAEADVVSRDALFIAGLRSWRSCVAALPADDSLPWNHWNHTQWADRMIEAIESSDDQPASKDLQFESLLAFGQLSASHREAAIARAGGVATAFASSCQSLDSGRMLAVASALRNREPDMLEQWLNGLDATQLQSFTHADHLLKQENQLTQIALLATTLSKAAGEATLLPADVQAPNAGSSRQVHGMAALQRCRQRCLAALASIPENSDSNVYTTLAAVIVLDHLRSFSLEADGETPQVDPTPALLARRLASDSSQPAALRIAATNLWANSLSGEDSQAILAFGEQAFNETEPQVAAAMLIAVNAALTNSRNRPGTEANASVCTTLAKRMDQHLLASLSAASPRLKPTLVRLISQSPQRLQLVLQWLQSGHLQLRQIGAAETQTLVRAAAGDVRLKLEGIVASATSTNRTQAVDDYAGCLELQADLRRGRQLFLAHCAACHQLEGVGKAVGPDISDSRTKQPLELLTAILDPNRAIDNNYFRYRFLQDTGDVLEGLIVEETAETITVRNQETERLTLRRDELLQVEATGLSLMPDGLESQIDRQSMADLIGYIKGWRYLDRASEDRPDWQDADQ